MNRALRVAAAVSFTTASGCNDLNDLRRDPSPERVIFVLLLAVVMFVADLALDAIFDRVLPPSMKTRGARWTMLGLIALATLAAVTYWTLAGRN